MAESIAKYIKEIETNVEELLLEVVSPDQAFTRYVLEEMDEKGNLGDAVDCYAVIRNEANNVIGQINGYSIGLSGETITLFYTIYHQNNGDVPYFVSADEYKTAMNRLQGYYNAAISGRSNEMEPSSADFQICKHLYENEDSITNVRLFVISNGIIKSSFKIPKQRIKDKPVLFGSWDINTLNSNIHSATDHMSVDIDLFDEEDYAYKIPFIELYSDTENYQTYIAILPGEFLYKLYEEYNTDLLQSNVRFYKGKNGCNKGIIETLKKKPHRFLAYNNGLTATAKDVLCEYNADGQTGVLKFIENFQILNGGQTTASIYYAKKADPSVDLSGVFVQMKLLVLHDNVEEFHPLITLFSNTQTKITPSDLSTNNPFNQKLQDLSRTILSPDPSNTGKISYWYYERVAGQYNQDLNRLNTKAEKDKFKAENPTTQKFDKCELGKVYTAWMQHPDVSINGPQKCYLAFIKDFKDKIPDQMFFEDFIGMLIIYRYMEKNNPVFQAYHQVKAQMTMYTMAMLNFRTNGHLSLYKIWQNQGLSDNLKKVIDDISKQLYQRLSADQPQTSTFRDFCKSNKTWEMAKKYVIDVDFSLLSSDYKSVGETETRRKAIKNITNSERRTVEELGIEFWDGLSNYTDTDLFTESERVTLQEVVSTLRSSRNLTSVQVFGAKQLLDKFNESGIDKDEILSKSVIKKQRVDRDSASLYKRIQALTDEDWKKIKLVVARACDENDAKVVKKIASQKDKSKLKFKQLVVVCRALDSINEKFKDNMSKVF